MTRAVAIIPARYGSTRLPGKPLIEIAGRPLVVHVLDRVRRAESLAEVVVATDDARIVAAVAAAGGRAVMTRGDHVSGTDRLVEAMTGLEADIVLNVQGDEPLVRPDDLDRLVATLAAEDRAAAATLAHPITPEEAADPDRVKVVTDDAGCALYFSRAAIPFARVAGATAYRQHMGVYAFRAELLRRWPSLPRSALEAAESLEQLRLLAAGIAIRVIDAVPTGPGVDTPDSLAAVRRLIEDAEARQPADSTLPG